MSPSGLSYARAKPADALKLAPPGPSSESDDDVAFGHVTCHELSDLHNLQRAYVLRLFPILGRGDAFFRSRGVLRQA